MNKQILFLLLMLMAYCFSVQKLLSQISFETFRNYPIEGTFSGHLATGDFNNDGKMDIVVRTGFGSNSDNNWKLFVYLQGDDYSLKSPVIYPYHKLSSVSGYERGSIASGDVNHDGLTDIVIGFNDSIGIFIQNIWGTLEPEIDYRAGLFVDAIKVGDVNNDGYNDIIVSLWSQPKIVAFFGENTGDLSPPYFYPGIQGGINDIEIAKLGSDAFNSVVKMNGIANSVSHTSIYRINIDRTMDTVIHYNIPLKGIFPYSIAVGDTNGNGNYELIYSHDPHKIIVWENLLGTEPEMVFDTPENIGTLTVGDLNCDGRAEICMLRSQANGLYVISNNIGSNFSIPCTKGTYQDALAIIDINSDGKPDIVSCNDQSGLSVLINTTDCVITDNNVDEKNEVSKIMFYPNPCFDFLNLENTKYGESILIRDITGKILEGFKGQCEKTTLNVNELNSGLYFVNVSGQTYKFIKN